MHLRDPPLCALVPTSLGASHLRASMSQGSPLCTLLATHLHSAASVAPGPPTASGLPSLPAPSHLPTCLAALPLLQGGGAGGSGKGCPAPRPEHTWPPLQQGSQPGCRLQASAMDGAGPQPREGSPCALTASQPRGAGCGVSVPAQVRQRTACCTEPWPMDVPAVRAPPRPAPSLLGHQRARLPFPCPRQQ